MNIENSQKEPEQLTDTSLQAYNVPEELITQWKKEYGTIFRLDFINESYIYRNFDYIEYKKIRNRIREEYKDDPTTGDEVFKEELQKVCVLWPKDYTQRLETGKPKKIPGGIPFLLGDYILAASGFADTLMPDVISDEV